MEPEIQDDLLPARLSGVEEGDGGLGSVGHSELGDGRHVELDRVHGDFELMRNRGIDIPRTAIWMTSISRGESARRAGGSVERCG